MAEVYGTLANLRRKNRSLWNNGDGGRVEWIHTTDDSRVFAFMRTKQEDAIFVILNLSESNLSVRLLGNRFAGKYKQVLPQNQVAEITFKGDEQIDLCAWEYRVFVR
jgi:glycosidase